MLGARCTNRARFSAQVCGAKFHVIYDDTAEWPIYGAIGPARLHDMTAAQAMPMQPGATYVFDLGHYDYTWWARVDAAQCVIVICVKRDAGPVIEELKLPEGSAMLSDCIGFLPERQMRPRRSSMGDALRKVRVLTDTGKELGILSNDLDATVQ